MLFAVVLANAAGCYSYRSVQPPHPSVGEEVQVELSGAGRDRLVTSSGVDVPTLTGTVLEADASAVTLAVRLRGQRLGFGEGIFVDTMRVARADARDIGVKELSTSKSVLAATAGVVAVIGAIGLFRSEKSGEGGDEPGDVLNPVSLIRVLSGFLGIR